MPSSEVQRTLVKSPPELWAELSNPASLAKHLGEFGEIRTTRVEPETAVEWEAGDVRGAVQLKPSGWGTKVTLTVVRELPAAESTPEVEHGPVAELTPPPAAEPEPEEPELPSAAELPLAAELSPAAEPAPAAALEEQPEALSAQRRPGLFARIFRRRRSSRATELTSAEGEVLAEPEVPALEEVLTVDEPVFADEPAPTEAAQPVLELQPAPEPDPEPEPAIERPDLAAELAQVEQSMLEQDTALLTAVLDRLGAAHHRPFSRG